MTYATATRPPAPGQHAPAAAISVTGLSRSYAGRKVLDGLTFDVRPQEIFGILGPNGAGKTTAVETIQGLRAPDAGTIRVLGLDPHRDRARLRHLMGAQLQSSGLPERLRVGEAVRLFARLAGNVVDWRDLLAQWGLEPMARTAFGSLSGGERQRLFIALALVNNPRVVFLDELTQGLDPGARRETWRLVSAIRDQGATVVLVTHFMDEAERLCDRVGVLHAGALAACGTPAELIEGAGAAVRTSFSCASTAELAGLESVPGVARVSHDGHRVEIVGDATSSVFVAAELVRRRIVPPDFTVRRPSLEDVFVAITSATTMPGGPR